MRPDLLFEKWEKHFDDCARNVAPPVKNNMRNRTNEMIVASFVFLLYKNRNPGKDVRLRLCPYGYEAVDFYIYVNSDTIPFQVKLNNIKKDAVKTAYSKMFAKTGCPESYVLTVNGDSTGEHCFNIQYLISLCCNEFSFSDIKKVELFSKLSTECFKKADDIENYFYDKEEKSEINKLPDLILSKVFPSAYEPTARCGESFFVFFDCA